MRNGQLICLCLNLKVRQKANVDDQDCVKLKPPPCGYTTRTSRADNWYAVLGSLPSSQKCQRMTKISKLTQMDEHG